VPDHLSLFEEAVVGVTVILVDEREKIIDDGRGGNGTLIVAIVVQETIDEDVLQRFYLSCAYTHAWHRKLGRSPVGLVGGTVSSLLS